MKIHQQLSVCLTYALPTSAEFKTPVAFAPVRDPVADAPSIGAEYCSPGGTYVQFFVVRISRCVIARYAGIYRCYDLSGWSECHTGA